MTLPELVEVADDCAGGKVHLSSEEKTYLVRLLCAYAQEVLNSGQCVQLGTVVLTKTIQGEAAVELLSQEP